MLQQAQQAEGIIGFYGLSDWWFTEFTEAERRYIERKYSPMGTGDNAKPLTHGKILESTGRASQLLWGLATWFKKPTDFRIAERILKKAEEAALDPVDLHYTYQQMIQVYYRAREIEPKALDNANDACKKQVHISSQVSEKMKSEYPSLKLPSHVGYKQLAIILEKQKNYAEAIQLLKQAQDQGWKGDWEERIARCEKKLPK
jgi:tetratricopeptide (TPR) repeat protein